jgi:hypothetical protein
VGRLLLSTSATSWCSGTEAPSLLTVFTEKRMLHNMTTQPH